MKPIEIVRAIAAPPEAVFRAVADIELLPEVVPNVLRTELLGAQREGVGTRFREVRSMNGKEMPTELEVTELRAPEHVRYVADSHGTIWDTTMRVVPTEAGSELRVTMDARGAGRFARVMNCLMRPLFRKGLVKHFDAVKAYCERQ